MDSPLLVSREEGILEQVNGAINSLKTSYEERYGVAILDVKTQAFRAKKTVLLKGYVLLSAQERTIQQTIRDIATKEGWQVISRLLILADPSNRARTPWVRPVQPVVNIFQNYSRLEQTISDDEIWDTNVSTQVTPADGPCRVLAKRDRWLLLQTDDLTLGWAPTNELESMSSVGDNWTSIHYAQIDSLTESNRKDANSDYKRVALSYLDVPYLGGGTTRQGVDCSGLVQRIYREVFGIVLPKHSLDQKKNG